jgi:hypothetical protein
MSCNLPVICSELNGITREFGYDQVKGLIYLQNEMSVKQAIEKAKVCVTPETRNSVLNLSWGNIGNRLNMIYQELLGFSKK